MFTKEDFTNIRSILLANKVAWTTAMCEVTVPAQNTGITTKISRRTIEILSNVQLIKTGDRVGASKTTLLNLLNISLFSFGLIIQQVFGQGSIYNPEVLDFPEKTAFPLPGGYLKCCQHMSAYWFPSGGISSPSCHQWVAEESQGAEAEEVGPPREPERRWEGEAAEEAGPLQELERKRWGCLAPTAVAGGPQFTSLWEWRRQAIQHCIQSLRHAQQYHDANCPQLSCQKMRWVVQHTKGCQPRPMEVAESASSSWPFAVTMPKHCQENPCPIPYCLNIKQKLRQQRYSTASSTRSS
ncbi:hypothetical protein QTO34_014345 [Cnephaeus nilssonii]|uniref:Large ribosomal subunit protein uL10 n=1 Tax=Cnephaeus nilssonii TaxID=3371016 RepID=A0AA40I659_CNENI|nr:hypothetical protein QTO34_014345 [Eptesicus nilssonii]